MTAGPHEDLARQLTTPALCGVYLARNEIIMLARLEDASLRPSERRRMLQDVLQSARTAEELRSMLARLTAFCTDSRARYQDLLDAFPACAPLLSPWIERADRTLRSLAELAEDLASG